MTDLAPGGRGPQIGRADLVRLLASLPPTGTREQQDQVFADWIRRLGLEDIATPSAAKPKAGGRLPENQTDSAAKPDPEPSPAPPPPLVPGTWPREALETTYWRSVGHVAYELPTPHPAPEKPVRFQWTNQPTTEAVAAPLLTWSQIAPRLRSLLAELGITRELDVPRAVDRLARGEVGENLPCRRRRQWGSTVQLWIDTSTRLIPYQNDFELICQQLQTRLGAEQIELFSGHGPNEIVWHYQRRGQSRTGYQLPPPGTQVLILGDLGCLDRASHRVVPHWVEFARRLRSRGSHPLALVPCSLARVPNDLRRLYRLHTLAPIRPSTASSQSASAIRRLLRWISFAVRVEPGLLRECRRLFPEWSDPALESDVWQQPEFRSRVWVAGTLGPRELTDPLIEQFEQLESSDLRREVLETFKRWRWRDRERGMGCEIFFEELSRLSAETRAVLPPEDSADLEAGYRWLTQRVVEQPAETREPLIDYAYRMLQRESVQSRMNPLISESLARIRGHFEGQEPGVSGGMVRIMLTQHGQGWVAQCVSDEDLGRRELPGSWLATLRARTATLFLRAGSLEPPKAGSVPTLDAPPPEAWQSIEIPAVGVVQLSPPGGGRIAVRTDCEGVELVRERKSAVALAAGRDRFGLWELTAIPNKNGPPVHVRWRWIPPGTFWMGSPENEPGRWDDEGPRHLVTLTKGCWMAETPCTQQLWQAVMGQNPSYFQNDQHPVETVSWLKVQKFLQQLRRFAPDLGVDLPTEAQWEYACRAGSETALFPTEDSDGRIEIVGERNAPTLHPIAWYGGNSAAPRNIVRAWDSSDWKDKQLPHTRASTQPVGLKLPNAWGLFDMLGNVWEWCQDEWGGYRSEPKTDPVRLGNAENYGVLRVARGGSWFGHARYVGCAVRYRSPAGDQGVYLGFRLVRVQKPS
jgi:formylglycine-generating enzyme required for sulfatase activity